MLRLAWNLRRRMMLRADSVSTVSHLVLNVSFLKTSLLHLPSGIWASPLVIAPIQRGAWAVVWPLPDNWLRRVGTTWITCSRLHSDQWFHRYDEVRIEMVRNRDIYAAEKAQMEYSYRAMETDRDTWKHMYEDVTGSKSFKALQTVKGIGRKKG